MVHFPREFLDGIEDEEQIDISSTSGVQEEPNISSIQGPNVSSARGTNVVSTGDSRTEAPCQIRDGMEDKMEDVIDLWPTSDTSVPHTTFALVLPTHNVTGNDDEDVHDVWPISDVFDVPRDS